LAREGLNSLMVLHDFLSHRLAPLQERSRGAWLYTGANDATRLERGAGPDTEMLSVMLRKLCGSSVVVKNIQIPHPCRPLCSNQAERRRVRDLMPTLDETGLAAVQADDRDRGVSIPWVPDQGRPPATGATPGCQAPGDATPGKGKEKVARLLLKKRGHSHSPTLRRARPEVGRSNRRREN